MESQKSSENGAGKLPDPGKGLGMLLLRARETIMAEYRPIFRGKNLTEQQWRILRFLMANSPMDLVSLSEKSVILAPSLARITKVLENRGLITKEYKKVGPTRVVLSITEIGRELVRSTAPYIAERSEFITSNISDSDRKRLVALLEAIADRRRI